MKKGVIAILSCLILLSCSSEVEQTEFKTVSTLPYFHKPDFTPTWIGDTISILDTLHTVLDFLLTNQNGELIDQGVFKGKIYVANFFFTSCPGICPKLTNHFEKLQDEFKDNDDFLLLSHSVMPSVDSVEVLKEYAERNHVNDSKWHLVTGPENDIKKLARFSYFSDEHFKETGDDSGFVHTENFVLIDKQGHIRGVYSGTLEFDVNRLIKHIKILQNE
jgi:protein SCO1/2